MTGCYENKQKMYAGVHNVLQNAQHKTLWPDNPPLLTKLVDCELTPPKRGA